MRHYETKQIRNVVLIGAPGAGKTTLVEATLLESGSIKRKGTVQERNTASDFNDLEQERGHSLYTTMTHAEWRDHKINLLDTPGLDDFIGEVHSACHAADAVLFVVNAQYGIDVSTEILWGKLSAKNLPSAIVINQIDHPKADIEKTITDINNKFGNKVVFPGNPEFYSEMVEKAAEADELLMEKYFADGDLSPEDLYTGLKKGIEALEVIPVFQVSANTNAGMTYLLDAITTLLPAPVSHDGRSLFVYKTMIDPFLGKVNYFKVLGGEISTGISMTNDDHSEKLGQLMVLCGKNRTNVEKLASGDIGAVAKLSDTSTGDQLTVGEFPVRKPIPFPSNKIDLALSPDDKNDEEKMITVLRAMREEDPTIRFEHSKELKQLIISGQGELHLEVVRKKLERSGVKTSFSKPKIPYRETIQKTADAHYRHKKQSGGSGQFGEVYLKILPYKEGMAKPEGFNIRGEQLIPLPWGGTLAFYNAIVGGVVDARFIPSVLKGIMEKMEEGPITGSYARDVAVVLHDGKMHEVDSNDISFKIAGMMAFKDGFLQASPQLLEPIYNLSVIVPEDLVGDVMADLQSRRSILQGIDSENGFQIIKAKTPLSELYKYTTSLKSITQGRADFTSEFAEYAVVPRDAQEKLAKEYTEAK